jgi:PhnB protein
MSKNYKPTGYNSVSPYFVVSGAQRLAELLKGVFNAIEKSRYTMPDGKIMHMELQIDDSILMMAEASDQFPANTHMIHVYVPNVDDTFAKAINLGCEIVEEPKEGKGDPNKRGAFMDFAGNVWYIATQL